MRREAAFPASLTALFRGEVGQPCGGFPKDPQAKVLKGAEPFTERRGAKLATASSPSRR